MKWNPWFAGVFKQNGKWGLMTVISSTERDFCSGNVENLKKLLDFTERLRVALGAKQKTFSGILPGIFFSRRMIRNSVEAEVTVNAVVEAERIVRKLEECNINSPIVISCP